MFDLTSIITAIIGLIAAILTGFVIPYLKQKYGNQKINNIYNIICIAVQAAEQIFAGSQRGQEKKQYVIDYLAKKGYALDAETIDNMIESAVLELNIIMNR